MKKKTAKKKTAKKPLNMRTSAKKAPAFPKTLGTCADNLYLLREERLKAQRKVDACKAEEATYSEHILKLLAKQHADRASGKIANVTRGTRPVATVDNWLMVHKFVKKHDAFDLLEKRISVVALGDRIADGIKVPGVTLNKVVKLSLTKR